MKSLFQDILSYLLLSLAKLGTPATEQLLSRAAMRLAGDVPDLSAHWVVQFLWPQTKNRRGHAAIDARIQQFGRFVRGFGHIQGQPGNLYEYEGMIRRNVLYGSFRRKNTHVLAGTGVFIVKINANSQKMDGACTWYASQLDDVWKSPYHWYRGAS